MNFKLQYHENAAALSPIIATATLSFIASAFVLAVALPAHAQFQNPEDAIKYRQSALSVMGTHSSRLGAMANGCIPFDAAAATANADIVADMAKLHWAAFGPDTDKGATKAKPEIWAEGVKFKEASGKLVTETTKLAAAGKTANIDNLKAAFGATAGSCKVCHDAYRAQ